MADLFTNPKAPVAATSGSAAPVGASGYSESVVGDEGGIDQGGVFREAPRGQVLGYNHNMPKRGLFRYDVAHGRGGDLAITASRADRMTAQSAGDKLHDVHVHFGIAQESEAVLAAFDKALLFCHTLNGASVLEPGRSTFGVPGKTVDFSYGEVKQLLGNDFRRFFRAFADQTATVNQQVLDGYSRNSSNEEASENYFMLMQVAHDRNMSRYPHLCHDSADACERIGLAERNAIAASKHAIIGATPNSVDGTKNVMPTVSADRLNSTNGTHY